MTPEDKQLLLVDLCGRLPFGVKIELTWWVMGEGTYINTILEPDHIEQLLNDECGDTEIKLYLRPMEDMTEDEVLEYVSLKESIVASDGITYFFETYKSIDWLNKSMFDYRGLIPNGLALTAPKGMYK